MELKYYLLIFSALVTVYFTDCSGKDPVTEESELKVVSEVTNISCYGDATGAIDLTVSGGLPPYSFSWNNGATTEDLSDLTAGNYKITVTDAKGLKYTLQENLSQPASALITAMRVTDVAHAGDNTGAVRLTIAGGTSPYSYLWSNGVITKDIVNVPEGNYSVTVTSASECKVILTGQVKIDPSLIGNPDQRIPNQGGFRNGQAMWDWLEGAGNIWWDGSNPIFSPTAEKVTNFVNGITSDAMKSPRPGKVKLYMQGYIPRLQNFSYEQAADNIDGFRNEWAQISRICIDAGYYDCVFGSSETQTDSKKWMPTADDIESGRWERAWKNMVDAVRSVMPDAKFAFVPMSGGGSGEEAVPDNGVIEKDKWFVSGNDKSGRPYMDFWGSTFYFGTRGSGCGGDCPVTKEVIDKSMEVLRTLPSNCHTNWGLMGHFQYAKEKGVKLVIGELGIFDRFAVDRYYGMGDQPYAIDLMTELLYDYRDQIEFVCWFNSRDTDAETRVWSRLDAGSSMPDAAKRIQALWGPDSPYRK